MCVVIDSAVWISLYAGGMHLSAVRLGTVVCAVDAVVAELLTMPDGEQLRKHGLRVEEASGSAVQMAYEWRAEDDRLSAADALSLALAHNHGWRLATRDGPLEEMAARVGVHVLHVVDVIGMLAEAELIAEGDIARFKKGMHDAERPYDKRALGAILKRIKRGDP